MDICYPTGTDWGCTYSDEQITALIPAVKERAEALAWSTLAALTGYRLSLCPSLLRPCSLRCTGRTWYVAPVGDNANGAFAPYIWDGSWYNGCGCRSDCSCTSMSIVHMPTEVGGIEAVWLDGALLDPTAYRVDNGTQLVRTDGGVWPACQDMNLPLTVDSYLPFSGTYGTGGTYEFTRESDMVTVTITPDATVGLVGTPYPDRFLPTTFQVVGGDNDTQVYIQNSAGVGTFLINRTPGNPPVPVVLSYLAVPAEPDVIQGNDNTFGVSYYPGLAANDLLRYAAGVLAVEFYQACIGNDCRLPNGVTNITRQGLTMEVQSGLFTGNVTGITEVDAIIRIYNPFALRQPPRVMSVDRPRGRVTTWGS